MKWESALEAGKAARLAATMNGGMMKQCYKLCGAWRKSANFKLNITLRRLMCGAN